MPRFRDEKVYYAHRMVGRDGRARYEHASPSRRWVELHGISAPIVEVIVRERADGDPANTEYWGWLRSGDDKFTMIWPSWDRFSMCFPYGVSVAEEQGRGRAHRLHVEEV